MIRLHSAYLDSTSADYLSRLRLGKTLFNNQLFTTELSDENTCKTCVRKYSHFSKHKIFNVHANCLYLQGLLIYSHINNKKMVEPDFSKSYLPTQLMNTWSNHQSYQLKILFHLTIFSHRKRWEAGPSSLRLNYSIFKKV